MTTTIETAYRVFYMSPALIKTWRAARDKQDVTNLVFVKDATGTHLSSLVRELRQIGLTAQTDERCPMRLQVPLDTLTAIGEASEKTGVPGATLLSICLSRASTSAPTKRRRTKN